MLISPVLIAVLALRAADAVSTGPKLWVGVAVWIETSSY